MSEQEPQGLLGFLQAELRALRIDLGGRIDRMQAQNTTEHARVRDDLADINSELRMASSKATDALGMAHEIKDAMHTHLELHQSRDDRENGAKAERNKVLGPLKAALGEVPKVAVGGLLLVAGYVIRSLA